MKGDLVIGESIADLGGLEIAYNALQSQAKKTGVLKPHDGREFFINYTRTEGSNVREVSKREKAIRDPHPCSEFRVNGTLAHIDSFYNLFDIKRGDKLYRPPQARAKIW